jgi:hypothetical protein
MTALYRRIQPKEGEPVQFLAVYATRWNWDCGEPTDAFIEVDEAAPDPNRAAAELAARISEGQVVDSEEVKQLKAEIERLKKYLRFIHELADTDIRQGLGDGNCLYQIEADARAALEKKEFI